MKKVISSSIITIIANFLFLILNGAVGFIMLIAKSLAMAFSGGETDALLINIIMYVLFIAMIFNLINIIFAICSIVKAKKFKKGVFSKKLYVTHLVTYLISIIVNIAVIVLLINGLIVVLNIVLTVIEIVAIILLGCGIGTMGKIKRQEKLQEEVVQEN